MRESFEEPRILVNAKTRKRLTPQQMPHIRGFQPIDNADIGQKAGFAKPYGILICKV